MKELLGCIFLLQLALYFIGYLSIMIDNQKVIDKVIWGLKISGWTSLGFALGTMSGVVFLMVIFSILSIITIEKYNWDINFYIPQNTIWQLSLG